MLDNAYALHGTTRVTNARLIPPAPKGRRCSAPGCTTTLSRYNRHEVCWLHFRPVPGPIPAPRRKRDDPHF
jgi:hypothetical protein